MSDMTSQEQFEKSYAEAHDMPLETFIQYRIGDTYRLPMIAKYWRFWQMAQQVGLNPAEQRQGDPVGYAGRILSGGFLRSDGYLMVAEKPEPGLDIPLYTHADPGEVERLREGRKLLLENLDCRDSTVAALRAEAGQHKLAMDAACGEIEALRAQLDERDALLQQCRENIRLGLYPDDPDLEVLSNKIDALSSSAEQSIPKCGTCHGQGEVHTGKMIDQGYWQPPEPDMEPCPFCGCTASMQGVFIGNGWWYGVACRSNQGHGGDCAMEQILSRTIEAAARRWNMRKPEASLRAEIERLEAQVRLAGVAGEMAIHEAVGRAATDFGVAVLERDQLKAENEALRKDAERYRWLRDQRPNAFHLSRNPDNSANYCTVEQMIQNDPEWFEGTPAEDLEKMAQTDTHWQIQIYPETPIGFHVTSRATLDEVIDAVMSEEAE